MTDYVWPLLSEPALRSALIHQTADLYERVRVARTFRRPYEELVALARAPKQAPQHPPQGYQGTGTTGGFHTHMNTGNTASSWHWSGTGTR